MDDSSIVEGKVDWKGAPAKRGVHGGVLVSLRILVTFAANCCALSGIAVNMVTYFTAEMHFGVAKASNALTNFMGTGFILAVVGAYVADAYVGRCRTVVISLCIEITGLLLLTMQAHFPSLRPPPCNIYDSNSHCEKLEGGKAAFLFISLYSLGIGMGSLYAGLPPHGADQFDDKDPRELRHMSSYFNCFSASNALASIIGLTLMVWIQTKLGWDWGFGIAAIGLFVGTLIFVTGLPKYRYHVNKGANPIVEIIQVFVAAFRNRNVALPKDASELYEIDTDKESAVEVEEILPHRDIFRCLDKAAIRRKSPDIYSPATQAPNPWRLCRVTQVENAKTIVGMVPIFACSIFMSTCLAQLQTFTVEQGLTMDSHLTKRIHIAPANLAIVPSIFLVIGIPIYDRLAVPLMRRFTGLPTGITHLQRIGVGLLLSTASMVVAAIVEAKRKKVAETHGMLDALPVSQPLPISIFWLVFQHFIFGISDMFTYVGLLEFFYSEAPKSLKSIATAFQWCSLGVGYFMSSILVEVVNLATRNNTKGGGWLAGNNLNRNHLDLFYWTLAILTFANFLNYLFWACRYEYKGHHNMVVSS